MFFPRLRRQAKWVFVFLAAVFCLGFVFFGVGSGSTAGKSTPLEDIGQDMPDGGSRQMTPAVSRSERAVSEGSMLWVQICI